MSAHAVTPGHGSLPQPAELGAKLVALAGIGLVGYGLVFLIRNFTGFIELGLTPEHVARRDRAGAEGLRRLVTWSLHRLAPASP